MCMQCVGAVGTAFQAATLIGGPIALKYLQRVRALLGAARRFSGRGWGSRGALEPTPPLPASGTAAIAPFRTRAGNVQRRVLGESSFGIPGAPRARARARATGGDRGPRTTRPGWVPRREASIPPGPARRGPRGTGISGRSPPVRHRR